MKEKKIIDIALAGSISLMVVYCLWPLINFYFDLNKGGKIIAIILLFVICVISTFKLQGLLYERWILPINELHRENGNRNVGLDIVRVVACILVITVHYIISMGYYNITDRDIIFFMASIVRWGAQCSCPLFMVLSGYFLCNRMINVKHYKGVWHLLRNYGVICIFYFIFLDRNMITIDKVKNLINLSEMWYINMYFGLFLLIPFLNVLWHNLDKKQQKYILMILFLLTSLFTITNFWWTSYWAALYPIFYYYIGIWLRQNPIKIKKIPGVILLIVLLALQSVFTYYANWGEIFDWTLNFGGYSCAYNCVPIVLATILIFLLLKDINVKNNMLKTIFRKISENSLELYLALCMFLGNLIFPHIWGAFQPRIGIVGCYIVLVPVEVLAGTVFGILMNKSLDTIQGIVISFWNRNKLLK